MLQLHDLAGIYFRAYYSSPRTLVSRSGTPVNAIRGTLEILRRMIEEGRPDRLVCCLDLDWRPQFRVDAIPSYKAQRVITTAAGEPATDGGIYIEEEPDDLGPQIPLLLDVLKAVGLTTAGAVGFEADDVIGTLAATATEEVEVVTGDRDLFQVATDGPPRVRVRYLGAGIAKMVVLDAAGVAAKYSIPAGTYADFAALRGDPSDGLPGVPGVGDKTAATLITRFGSLTGLVEASLDPSADLAAGVRAKLRGAADYLAVAETVVRVATDAEVGADGDGSLPRVAADPTALATLTEELQIENSVDRLLETLAQRS